uniref:26S proteasome non-ATPase regulatory subunit 5 n=1 Tax=Oncorhynchus tshawytscha TaxID=74940 RepID=A0A8C8H5Q5_ONCTS
MAASIESLFVEIASLEEPIEELQTLKTAVLSIPVSALRDTVSGLRLEVIFSLLNTNDREKIELCVDILGRILLALSPVHLAQNCRVELQAGLKHPDDTVKILALTQIGRMVLNHEAVTEIQNNQDILREVIHCIKGEKMTVAKELIVDISSVSPVSLGYCANSSFISQLLGELTGDDVLVRATAIEMVTTLSHSQHGRQYLAQQGIMDKISNMITGAKSDPFSSFYLPGLVKFFGNLAIMDSPQHVCETYPAFQNKVFEMAIDPDPVMTGVALDTLGVLGSTVEGKQVLQKTGEKFNAVLKRMSKLASGGATELRVRCLEAISLLITLQAEQQTEDLLVLTESWFHLLSNQPMEMIRNISTQPFPELHCSALRIFTAIAPQPWGQRLMIGTPGFMEFIVDRSTGPTKEAKDAKFELVGALVSSSTAADILGSQHYLRLRSYLREGAYYVAAVATVTTEGAD